MMKITPLCDNDSFLVSYDNNAQDYSIPCQEINKIELLSWIVGFSQELLLYDDISAVLDVALIEARKISYAEAGNAFLKREDKLFLAFSHNDSLYNVDDAHKHSYSNVSFPIDKDSVAGYCTQTKLFLNLKNVNQLAPNSAFTFNDSLDKLSNYSTVSLLCLPVVGKQGRVLGLIQLINCIKEGKCIEFDNSIREQLSILAVHTASAIERCLLYKIMINRMQTLVAINDPKETDPHIERIGALTAELFDYIAIEDNVPAYIRSKMRAQMRMAAMLHDIGKIVVPKKILKKPGKLTAGEFLEIQKHCANSKYIFINSSNEVDQMANIIALHHHQKWDGKGYTGSIKVPLLSGNNIPLAARIVAIADVFDALVSVRCYKTAWSWEDAIVLIKKDAGTHFDPRVVHAFLKCEDTVKSIYARYKD